MKFTKTELVEAVTRALDSDHLEDGRLAAAARILTGTYVKPDYVGAFDGLKTRPATPVDANGFGAWTKLCEAQPRVDECVITFPWMSDCGILYDFDRQGLLQIQPYDTRSFLVFPQHPDHGGTHAGVWRT